MRAPEDLQVVVAGDVVGRVLVGSHEGEVVVVEARLSSAEHAPVLDALLTCRAIATGATSVVLAGSDGALGALVAAGGYEIASQRLRLDLPTDRAADLGGVDDPAVRLERMGAEAFSAFVDQLADDYVSERTGSGETAERARAVMEEQLATLLPDGVDSPDQHLFTGWAGSTTVGHLWLGTERSGAFVYFVEVAPEERRRGWGAALMQAGAAWARERGETHVALNVFGQNQAARALYARLGYEATETTYRRAVPSP